MAGCVAETFTPARWLRCFDPRGRVMRSLLALAVLLAVPATARAQATGPLGPPPALLCDLTHATPGSWADYAVAVTAGPATSALTIRWAYLKRDAGGSTVELTVDKPPTLGGKVVTRMVLVPDPIGTARPFKQIVVQQGEREPQDIPLEMPGLPQQKFQNPDPKKLVDRPTITVPAGTFATNHYRDVLPDSTVDSWLSDQVHPLGVVKIQSTPNPEAEGPGGKPLPPVTMELLARGGGARPVITRKPTTFAPGAPRKE
jgi:hypothetical protein